MTFSRRNIASAKLTPQSVLEIRQLYNDGWSQGRLARHFHVSVITIGRVVRGESWQQYYQEPHPDEIRDSEARFMQEMQAKELFDELAKGEDAQGISKEKSEIEKVDEFIRQKEGGIK